MNFRNKNLIYKNQNTRIGSTSSTSYAACCCCLYIIVVFIVVSIVRVLLTYILNQSRCHSLHKNNNGNNVAESNNKLL